MNELISIVVPVYNMQKYLKRCISSIILQTYNNIEILLINDGSTDKSADICNSLADSVNYIRVFHKENEGVSLARNLGIQFAVGSYIMFVDPDDWLSKDIVQKLLNKATSSDSDIVSCGASIETEGKAIKNSFYKGSHEYIEKKRAIAQLFSNDFYNDADDLIDIGVPWGKLYKRSFLIDYSLLFVPELRRNQDNIFNLYAFHYSNYIAYVDEPLYHYNYSHYKEESGIVNNDVIGLNTRYADEMTTFFLKYYSDDQILSTLYKKKLCRVFMKIMTFDICNPRSPIELSERINKIEQVCETSVFSLLFSGEHIPHVSIKATLIIRLFRSRKYKVGYGLYLLRYAMKHPMDLVEYGANFSKG